LKRYCRRRQLGLLITSHAPMGLPEIFCTYSSLEMAINVVEQLLQNERIKISTEIIDDLFSRHGGNIRELLFDLYDLYQQKMKDEA